MILPLTIFGIPAKTESDGSIRAVRFPFRGQVGKVEDDPYRWRWVLVLHPWELRLEEGVCQSGVQAIVAMEKAAFEKMREMSWFLNGARIDEACYPSLPTTSCPEPDEALW